MSSLTFFYRLLVSAAFSVHPNQIEFVANVAVGGERLSFSSQIPCLKSLTVACINLEDPAFQRFDCLGDS
jgi:hypothetical protein